MGYLAPIILTDHEHWLYMLGQLTISRLNATEEDASRAVTTTNAHDLVEKMLDQAAANGLGSSPADRVAFILLMRSQLDAATATETLQAMNLIKSFQSSHERLSDAAAGPPAAPTAGDAATMIVGYIRFETARAIDPVQSIWWLGSQAQIASLAGAIQNEALLTMRLALARRSWIAEAERVRRLDIFPADIVRLTQALSDFVRRWTPAPA